MPWYSRRSRGSPRIDGWVGLDIGADLRSGGPDRQTPRILPRRFPTGDMTYRDATWPDLPLSAWKDTYATLHLWTQIVGKIRLAQTPWLNHSWHVVLYVSARGLTTSAIPYGDRSFQLDFDFLDHVLRASASDGGQEEIGLYPRSVADFYAEVMRSLAELGINIRINELPNEIPDAIRFSEDPVHASYDREYAERFWRILVQSARVLGKFRTNFIGKCSPVHFFWAASISP